MKILRFERKDEAVAWAKKVIGIDGMATTGVGASTATGPFYAF